MVSRDTAVHVQAVLLAFLVLAFLSAYDAGPETGPASVAAFLVFYGLVLGGAHFYLAIRGEDGLIPVEARWRYVVALAVLLVAGAVLLLGGEYTVGPVATETIATVVIVVTAVAYLVTESIAGYRATRSE